MKVIVIGAGIGGLCLANGLHNAGFDVSIHEATQSPRPQGYRLHLNDDGINALTTTLPPETWKTFEATARVPKPRFVHLDTQLNPLDVMEHPGRHLSVDRTELRQTLLSPVKPLITYGKRLTTFHTHPYGVTAHFTDGTTASGDILIGADGINSAVRHQHLPHARITDTGLVQLYGKLPLSTDDKFSNIFTAITGPEHRVVGLGATRDYLTCSFSTRTTDLGADLHHMPQNALRSAVMDRVSTWHPQVRDMIARWQEIFPVPLRTCVPVAPWPTSRVTLLGDAIHAMSPAGGVGANTALRDAATLTAALTTGASPLAAIHAYEKSMTDYAFTAVHTSAALGTRFLGQNPLPT
ncbi:FAD-dependent oxidoreductase [Nonomuraea sp. NPDC050556]|uniref:FAD-dependent oxidoreductase n=1 Tax=Nonomuraea sp. NPDC050556 TaxID=3364369 RepID=UPI0037B03607